MKTSQTVIIGFVIIFTIFGMSTFLQWQCAQQIHDVEDYHRMMSIPAVTILNEVTISFQKLHVMSVNMVQTDLTDKKYLELESKYQKNKENFENALQKYDSLTYAENSRGEAYAPIMMQNSMQNYVSIFKEIVHDNDLVLEQYENNGNSKNNLVPQLASLESDFHNAMEKNLEMEINGMKNVQNQIIGIENKMEMIFQISIIVGSTSSVLVVLLIIRFVSVPLSQLARATKSISLGEATKMNVNSINSDVNNVLKAYNEISKDLEDYKSIIIKQEKLSSIGELASRLAHDIKNPLTVIKATLDMLKAKNQNLPAEDIEKFERVDSAMQRITHQIDNVLDFIKDKPLKLEKHSINDILQSALVDLPKSDKIIIEIISEDIEIECDYEAMKVALINLLVNAMQAIQYEGKIKVISKIRNGKAIIQIEDDGPGIPKEILEEIFEPLFTTKQEGTGLGLVSCKSIIEQHGGKISVKNNPTRFIIELPLMKKG